MVRPGPTLVVRADTVLELHFRPLDSGATVEAGITVDGVELIVAVAQRIVPKASV